MGQLLVHFLPCCVLPDCCMLHCMHARFIWTSGLIKWSEELWTTSSVQCSKVAIILRARKLFERMLTACTLERSHPWWICFNLCTFTCTHRCVHPHTGHSVVSTSSTSSSHYYYYYYYSLVVLLLVVIVVVVVVVIVYCVWTEVKRKLISI